MAVELGDKIDYFITINEPQNYAWYSYGSGLWPPQKTNYLSVIKVMLNLAYAHKQAYKIIKSVNKRAQVGVASSLTHNVPFRPKNIIHKISAKLANYANNWWFIDQTENEQDFIGCNYYFKNYSIRPTPEGNNNPAQPLNDLGWYMEPRAISELLIATHKRYLKPIIITENGVADRSDQYRKWWLEETLRGMSEALSGGVIIVGYLHWSLLDNFEWAHGFWPRFGLIEVDRQTLGRKIRPSAKWFGDFIQTVRSKTADH
jgi:beta-glucosidase